jgi:hypothetical protein
VSVDKDPAVYTLLVSAVMALLGLLNLVGIGILKYLKSNDDKLFTRVNHTDSRVTKLEARCEERHKHDK